MVDHVVLQVQAADFGDAGRAGIDLDVHADAAAELPQDVLKTGDGHLRVGGGARRLIRSVLVGEIALFEFREGVVRGRPLQIGRAVEGGVMQQDGHAVLGHAQVELDHVAAPLYRLAHG